MTTDDRNKYNNYRIDKDKDAKYERIICNQTFKIEKGDKILIIGHGKHGKDTIAEIMEELFGLKFNSSSKFALESFLFDILNEKYKLNYKSKDEAFKDRNTSDEKRMIWYNEICTYNKDDKTRLTKEILKENDMYVGLRDYEEFKESRKLFKYVVWIEALERVKYSDPTVKIEKEEANIIINNNGTLKELEEKVKNTFYTIKN